MADRASPALVAIRESQALKAAKEYGLPCGSWAAWARWQAQQRGAGQVRTGLLPLATVEAILWQAALEWGVAEGTE